MVNRTSHAILPYYNHLSNMPPTGSDPRKYVGGRIHAKATFITAVSECRRRYGARYKDKMLNGTVLNCSSKTSRTSNKRQTFVQGEFEIGDTTRVVELLLRNVGRGHIPDINGDNQSQSLLSHDASTTTVSTNNEDDSTIPFPNGPQVPDNSNGSGFCSCCITTRDNAANALSSRITRQNYTVRLVGVEPNRSIRTRSWS